MGIFQRVVSDYGIVWIIGQLFGIIAIILGFVSYQVRTKRQLLFVQSAVSFVFCIHFFLIGAYSGMAMNAVSLVRNFVYDYRMRKGDTGRLLPCVFVGIQILACLITWEAWYSVFILLGLCINTYCMSFTTPQSVRKSILITSPLVLIYDLFARSVGGSIFESVSVVSAAIGILRNRTKESHPEN